MRAQAGSRSTASMPPPGRASSRALPPCGDGDRPHDREPEPRAAARTRRVGAAEALERAPRELRGRRPRRGRRRRARSSRRRVRAPSVTGPPPWRSALSTRLPSACSSRAGRPAARARRASTASGRSSSAARPAKRSRTVASRPAASSGSRPQLQLPGVGPRHHEQVVGEPAEPHRLLQRGGDRRAQLLGRALAPERDLELAAQDRQRRAQLVAGVRGERPLGLQRPLEPRQHLVQRVAEPVDLVVRPRYGQPLRRASGRRSATRAGASARPAATRRRPRSSPRASRRSARAAARSAARA